MRGSEVTPDMNARKTQMEKLGLFNAFKTSVVRTRGNRGDGQKTEAFKKHVPSPDSNTCPCS